MLTPTRDANSQLGNARCVENFDAVVAGATSPSGEPAVILGMLPPDGKGWTFPLPIAEARRIAALLVEVADAKSDLCAPLPERGRLDPCFGAGSQEPSQTPSRDGASLSGGRGAGQVDKLGSPDTTAPTEEWRP